MRQVEKSIENDILTEKIIGAAIQVHRELGPGLLESTYETCLCHELSLIGLKVERQKAIPISYKGIKLVSSLESFLRSSPIFSPILARQ